jgi:hypothetical protein
MPMRLLHLRHNDVQAPDGLTVVYNLNDRQ